MAVETIRNDDFVEYFLFPKIDSMSEEEEGAILTSLLSTINEISRKYTKSYIWHKESFGLKVRTRSSHLLKTDDKEVVDTLPAHLYGISYFGDNIQDEWFIVSLLFHISRAVPDLIIRTSDSDGEFLLIEAAELLPQWASPETCENAVYIYNGNILLLKSPHQQDDMNVSDAIDMIRTNPKAHQVSDSVGKAVYERIQQFSYNLDENFHNQCVYVPVAVAALLRHNSQFIAPAVQAFCNRDPIDMKACRAMRYFPPENRVYTNVKFTKCLYAMLMHNNYLPDRRTGWQMPSPTSPQFKSHLIGVKLACGFEILASQTKPGNLDDVENDREWAKYLESLKARNYFRDLIEGSKGYQELLKQAKEFYSDNRDNMKTTPKIGQEILLKLKELDISVDEFRQLESSLADSDSDDWLNIAVEDLDAMLAKRYGIKNLLSKDPNANSGQLSEMLSEFLDKKSEYDGVDMNSNVPSVNSTSTTTATENLKPCENGQKSSESKQSNQIDFNPDAFASIVQNMLDLVIPEDDWESASDMSDYENDENLLAKDIDELTKKSFVKGNVGKKKSTLDAYMDQMDRELAKTAVGKSFESEKRPTKATVDDFDDVEDFQPVDIDMNAVKNMMESFQLQGASAGPTTNLINSIIENKESNV